MTTSAKIYDFPARGRFAKNYIEENTGSVSNLASLRNAKIAVGGAWYHDEAIQTEFNDKTKN